MAKKKGITYAGSGVDIYKEIDGIAALIGRLGFKRKGYGGYVDLKGHYTGIIDCGDIYLSLCIDGVGSKLMIADAIKKWDTVGIDCVAMNTNDMICIGAEPLAFVDYIGLEKMDVRLMDQIGIGLNEGAKQSNVSIIGGETASLPDMVKGFDLAGTCMGWVKKDRMVEGRKIRGGDVMIGVPSTGLHSNGYSLVRKAIEGSDYDYGSDFETVCKDLGIRCDKKYKGMRLGEVCLIPTRIYVKMVLALVKQVLPHGLAHITGGGFKNIPRLNRKVDFIVEDPMPVHPIFHVVQRLGSVPDIDMYQTFNMGMGFCIIAHPKDVSKILKIVRRFESGAKVVGRIAKGKGIARHVPLGLRYTSL